MAENKIGSGETPSTRSDKIISKVKTPKNVRQIGKIGEELAIYVEDYVKTYTKQMAENDYASRCAAVLVGEYRGIEERRNVFIYGSIKIELDVEDSHNAFNDEVWANIYEQIKQYFPDAEIVGWYYGGTGFGTEDLTILEEIQTSNFNGRDKVLLTYDALEKEMNFYLYDGISMILQPGYYIYYEKNEEMQTYMVDHKKPEREEEKVDDHAIREMRTILNERKPPVKEGYDQKLMMRLGYAAGGLLIVVALIVGVTMLNNAERMKGFEDSINTLSQNMFERENTKKSEDQTKNEGKSAETKKSTKDETMVNKVDAQVTPVVSSTPSDAEPIAAVSATPAPEVSTAPAATLPPEATPQPTAEPVTAVDPSTLVEYTVKAGDTLASISLLQCGSYSKMSFIKDINQIQNENLIFVGQKLLIPKN